MRREAAIQNNLSSIKENMHKLSFSEQLELANNENKLTYVPNEVLEKPIKSE